MEFRQPKGIYQQIADQMRDRILAGEWHEEGERIPSVRELAVGVGVNPNTVTKSYQALLDREIIENQRRLGYFVATDAKQRIVAQMRDEFVRDELPRIFRTMRVLGMQLEDLAPYFAFSKRRTNVMRTSQRVVAATLGAIVVLLVVIAVSIRVTAPRQRRCSRASAIRKPATTRTSTASRSAVSGKSPARARRRVARRYRRAGGARR